MDTILEEFQTDFYKNINLMKNEHLKLIIQTNELKEKNNLLEQENTKLTNIINELNKEKKAKASSTIWESMNSKLAEKDVIIEQLKKDIEFYKRTGTKSNISEKWQSNISKSNSYDSMEVNEVKEAKKTKEEKTPISNKSVEKENELTNEEHKVVKDKNIDSVDDEKEQDDELHVKKLKKHKSKDKSKDKSEKKKKKKKKNVEEENE